MTIFLVSLPVNRQRLSSFEAERLHEALSLAAAGAGVETELDCSIVVVGEALEDLAHELAELGPINEGRQSGPGCLVTLSSAGRLTLARLGGSGLPEISVRPPNVSWTSLMPALLAVTIAIVTRRLLSALALGVVTGAVLAAADGSVTGPLLAASAGSAKILLDVLTVDFHVWIFLFTFSLIGMVNVATLSGGMAGLAEALGRLARGSRSTQMATAALGLAIFFDDYSNTVVVGSSMRPLSDRVKVSREKLAYLVDSTAAPIAGLALVSTWIGYEVSLIGDAMADLNLDGSPYALFVRTLPFRFYCLMTIGFVWLNIWLGREFGPMHDAQLRAETTGRVLRPGSRPLSGAAAPSPQGPPLARNALVPVLTVIFATLIGMALNGAGILAPDGLHLAKLADFDFARLMALEDNYLVQCRDGGWVLALASLTGSALAVVMGACYGRVQVLKLVRAWFSAWRILIFAFSLLILAWSIGHVNDQLGTGAFLVSSLADTLPSWLLPVLIFILAAVISFSTGSSWSTMAVLIPAAVPLAYHLGGPVLMVVSVGAVLDGSIFGDHCSPLSDTTIMSSIAAGCDHLDHVRTQLPYAVVVGLSAAFMGYITATFLHPLISCAVALLAFWIILRLVGRPVDSGAFY